jgi:hypothetical protein
MSALTRITAIVPAFLLLIGLQSAIAQNPNNPLLYSYQANLFAERGAGYDPVTLNLPGTAFAGGFASYLDNPASIALFEDGFTSIGLSYRHVNEDGIYLDNNRQLDDNQMNLSNLGFVYSMPTQQGSFVVGAGYTQHANYNRAFGFRGRNNQNTITDKFKAPGSSYADIAFNTYATDYGDEFEDWDESILRMGFDTYGDFLGMRQQGEIFQRGQGGEYSFFLGTEFQQNFMIGLSAGLITGRMTYDRLFQEVDEFNDYDSQFIDSNEDGMGDTDIDNILLEDRVRSSYLGFRARAGAIYRVNEHLNLGASYTFGSRINIEEDFDARIRTTFNNGVEFSDDLFQEFSYRVELPSQTSLGAALVDVGGLSASFSADYIDYSSTRIDFRDGDLFEDELAENDFISETYRAVWNLRAGASLAITPDMDLRGGYSFYPSRFRDGTDDRTVISGGLGFALSPDIRLELAATYTTWEETSSVYDYAEYDYSPLPDAPPAFEFRSQEATRAVDRWNVLATLRFNLY